MAKVFVIKVSQNVSQLIGPNVQITAEGIICKNLLKWFLTPSPFCLLRSMEISLDFVLIIPRVPFHLSTYPHVFHAFGYSMCPQSVLGIQSCANAGAESLWLTAGCCGLFSHCWGMLPIELLMLILKGNLFIHYLGEKVENQWRNPHAESQPC